MSQAGSPSSKGIIQSKTTAFKCLSTWLLGKVNSTMSKWGNQGTRPLKASVTTDFPTSSVLPLFDLYTSQTISSLNLRVYFMLSDFSQKEIVKQSNGSKLHSNLLGKHTSVCRLPRYFPSWLWDLRKPCDLSRETPAGFPFLPWAQGLVWILTDTPQSFWVQNCSKRYFSKKQLVNSSIYQEWQKGQTL
jgi:hypothetical protein